MSVNYDYIVDSFSRLDKGGTFLDFGCGAGKVVEKGVRAGLDFWGADAYPEGRSPYHDVMLSERPEVADRIRRIENETLPFPDNHFTAVSTNMVFEHISDLARPLSEIHRVLKPGGLFLALFPTSECWWEGHVRLYFPHMMAPGSDAQFQYLRIMNRLGLGKKSEGESPEAWARNFQNYLRSYCFYHEPGKVGAWWRASFGKEPESIESDFMAYRLQKSRLKNILPVFDNAPGKRLLKEVCRRRACRVLTARKAA